MTGVLLKGKCCGEACCLPDGTCENMSRELCIERGGTPQGCDTSCEDEDIQCEDVQACCFDDGNCADLSPAECKALEGVPQGKGTECAETDCPAPQPCPSQNTCDCAETILVSVNGIGYNSTEFGCSVLYSHDFVVPISANSCLWGTSIIIFEVDDNTNCPPSDEGTCVDLFTLSGFQCFPGGEFWRGRLGIAVRLNCSQLQVWGQATLTIEKPNTDGCPFGDYVVTDIMGTGALVDESQVVIPTIEIS